VLRRLIVIALVALVAGGCDWPQWGYGPAHAGWSPDTSISTTSVASLHETWEASNVQPEGPVVSGGSVYLANRALGDGGLSAYDSIGGANCSGTPVTCPPQWEGTWHGLGATGPPAVDSGRVYVADVFAGVNVFDARGAVNCTGTAPRQCTPLFNLGANGTVLFESAPTVAYGTVFVSTDTAGVEAFDAAGVTNCAGTPKTCTPLWHGNGTSDTNVAVADGVAYVGGGGGLDAYDAHGTTNCGGTPKQCAPLWSAPMGSGDPVVANGVVYVTSGDTLYAFDARGTTNCAGTPKQCAPLWTATTGGAVNAPPAIGNSTVFVGSADHKLYAFDARGGAPTCTGAPKQCVPLWTATTGGSIYASPTVANGVVYLGSFDGHAYAFDAAGKIDCSGSPKSCSPLWDATISGGIDAPVVVSNGRVYFESFVLCAGDNCAIHTLHAYEP
jgi:outer membrane protein assembly factor BamB